MESIENDFVSYAISEVLEKFPVEEFNEDYGDLSPDERGELLDIPLKKGIKDATEYFIKRYQSRISNLQEEALSTDIYEEDVEDFLENCEDLKNYVSDCDLLNCLVDSDWYDILDNSGYRLRY